MQYKFINNFTVTLGVGMASTDTVMILSEGAANFADASATVDAEVYYPLTLVEVDPETLEELSHEIVYVTGVAGSELTVLRGQEGTTAPATWASGTPVSSRVTAGIMHELTYGTIETGGSFDGASLPVKLGPVVSEYADGAVLSILNTADAWAANGEGTVLVGNNLSLSVTGTAADLVGPVMIGGWGTVYDNNGYGPITIGHDISVAQGAKDFIVIGTGANFYSAANGNITLVGVNAYGGGDGVTAVGRGSGGSAARITAMGVNAGGQEDGSTIFGADSYSRGVQAVMAGPDHYVNGNYSVTLGINGSNYIDGGFQCHAVSFLTRRDDEPTGHVGPNSQFRASQQVVLRTDKLNLSAANEFELVLPTATRMFIDEIDVVATTAVSGSPGVAVGTATTGVDVAAATALTVAAAWDRQKITPATDNGVAGSLFGHVSTTGTGEVYLVVKGYLIET